MRPAIKVGAAVLVGALVTTTGYAVSASAGQREILGPGSVTVEMGIQHSEFSVGSVRVYEGTLVELVVQNDDPIAHELVVGTEEVHRRHREGSERQHPPVPGEVSVGPGERGLTFVVLDDPGTYEYVCHLPGHEAYGMKGEIEVVSTD
jgi:uncharacterized cupredoxin-like copper-binding protein